MKNLKMKGFKRGDDMVLKVVCGIIGAIVIAGVAMVAPDIKRYMRLRSM